MIDEENMIYILQVQPALERAADFSGGVFAEIWRVGRIDINQN